MTLELIAPAKLNLALEITGRRPDGYHELVTVMQTIDLSDIVRVSGAPALTLSVKGEALRHVPKEGPRNLAIAAAQALVAAAGKPNLGAHIELEKCIPAGMGLGGGSSDAAAVLRGLNQLWGLGFGLERLCEVGAQIGSDVPFFVHGGSALVTGRGEYVEPLLDTTPMPLTLFATAVDIEDKTRRMYSLIDREDFTDGARAHALAEVLRSGAILQPSEFVNAFDRHVEQADEQVGLAMRACRAAGVEVFVCGSGPGFFAAIASEALPPRLAPALAQEWGIKVLACRTLGRAESTAIREV